MRRHSRPGRRRRLVSGLTIAGLLTSATAGVAQADDTQAPGTPAPIPVSITGPDHHDLSLEESYPAEGQPSFEIGLRAPGEADMEGNATSIHQGDFTVTIDASKLEGVADVKLPCDPEGLVAVCSGSELYAGEVHNPNWDVRVRAADGAEAGAAGSITVTGEGEGLTFTGHTVNVLVGGPEFEMRKLTEPEGFAAGEVFRAGMGFRNVGGVAADGVVLRFTGSRGLTFPQKFSNCSYAVENEDHLIRMRRVALCTFEGEFEPGVAYRLSTPVKVKTADFALRDILGYRFTSLASAGTAPIEGEGQELTLERVQGDSAAYTRHAALDFPTGNTYDLDLAGDRAKGAEGETVTVDVALHNRGPAWIGDLRSGGEGVHFTVGVPDGATVVKAPDACHADEEEGGRVLSFWCQAETPLLEQDTREFAFDLRIDEVVEGATGRMQLAGGPHRSEADPANDDGWIVLNGTGDEETPGDTGGQGGSDGSDGTEGSDDSDDASGDDDGASASGGSGGGDGDGSDSGTDTDGGSLALTGTGAMTLGGVALALLAAGGGLIVVRRRRAAEPVTVTDDAAA